MICSVLPGFAQAKTAANDWVIVPGVRIGPITGETTRADLQRLFGAANVKDAPVYVGEGFEEPGTIVLSSDPTRSLAVLWSAGGTSRVVESVYICRMVRKRCRWHTSEGISMGTDLKTLEKQNGRPFRMVGIDMDYQGTVTSWEGGRLQAERGRMLVRLDLAKRPPLDDAETDDGDLLSAHPAIQRLNPVIYEIIVEFENEPGK
jgi:hypothetical protein